MNRRNFIKYSSLATLALMSTDIWAAGNSSNSKHWVWMGTSKEISDAELMSRFIHLKKQGITGVFIGGDDERYFRFALSQGLEAHLWVWIMNRRDKELMENHPDWYAVNRKGESCHDQPPYVDYYRWLCPSKKEVIAYLENDIRRLAAKPYIQGIHLDYIRYCDVILPRDLWEKYDLVQKTELPEFDYCYCETCCNQFEKEQGIDPKLLKDPSKNKAWKQFRYQRINHIVNQLSKVVHKARKPISAAVFPSPSIAKKLVRQDWVNWNLDMIFPMLYQSFYRKGLPWICREAREGVRKLKGKFPLYAGLYLPALKTPDDLVKAMQEAKKGGAVGVSLFGKMTDAHWKAFEQNKTLFE